MKITEYKLLTEDFVNNLIKADQKQTDIKNGLKDMGFDKDDEEDEKPVGNPKDDGLYNIKLYLETDPNGETDGEEVNGKFTITVNKDNDLITLKNDKTLIKIKYFIPFKELPIIGKAIKVKYVNGYINKEAIDKKYKFAEFDKLKKVK